MKREDAQAGLRKLLQITFLIFCIKVSLASAQNRPFCGTTEYLRTQERSNSYLYKDNFIDKEKIYRQSQIQQGGIDSTITIPVVIHVVYNKDEEDISDIQILSQLNALNQDFRRLNSDTIFTPSFFRHLATDTHIEFKLAQRDPFGNPTIGITRKKTSRNGFLNDDNVKFNNSGGMDIWDRDSYLNIWICNLSNGTLGYSQSPGMGAEETDGVVIDYRYFGTVGTVVSPFNKGRTTTHEIGHWLNLKHVWGDAKCGDDLVEDTPMQESYTSNCKVFPFASCNNSSDMFMNYMDYSFDACMNLFTVGQKDRMRTTLSTLRSKLLDSQAIYPINLDKSDKRIFSLYPNPLNEILYIESFISFPSFYLQIFDSTGKILISRSFYSLNLKRFQINLSNLTNGLYIIRITASDISFTKKIIVVH